MTAGQRNCCIAIDELMRRYTIDDVLFAIHKCVTDESMSCDPGRTREVLESVAGDIDQISRWLTITKH